MQCSGGSSIVLRRASNAFFERLCASSIIYIFFGSIDGRYVIDAKSIMGIFSLDLSKPIDLNIHADGNVDEILAALDSYIIK